ncbi:MAG: DUF494 family protein [Candidatus Hydrogenedentes bacterium]|jgi:uncharacterized protein Smg (DUF494 family)|nr:DUF494 family protein [Candidatus Hydrogenedentota bacterium]
MKNNPNKLVRILLEHVDSVGDKPLSEETMRSLLQLQGHNHNDIDFAIKIVNDYLSMKPTYSEKILSLRQLAFFESTKISEEVLQTITRLELFDLLEPFEREMLLERFLHSEGQADMEALDYALSFIVGTMRNAEVQQTMMTVFEGYEPTYH